jgi:RNA polymerase sigma-70 factor (ECF subfamily)
MGCFSRYGGSPIEDTEFRAAAEDSRALRPEDARLIGRLRDGDQAAFTEMIRSFGPTMLRIARLYVRSDEVAEEVVQEAWISVLEGLERFQGRSAFRTWVLTIVVHSALRRGQREARSAPFSSVGKDSGSASGDDGLELDRFFSGDHPRWPSTWTTVVPRLEELPEEKLLSGEAMGVVETAISQLPDTQAAVLILHDIEGLPAEEICETLELADGNRRILLHRARNRVRAALEHYFDDKLAFDA